VFQNRPPRLSKSQPAMRLHQRAVLLPGNVYLLLYLFVEISCTYDSFRDVRSFACDRRSTVRSHGSRSGSREASPGRVI
jgi:hypothetical protein